MIRQAKQYLWTSSSMPTRLVIGGGLFLSLVVVGLVTILFILEHRSPLRYEQGRWHYFSLKQYDQFSTVPNSQEDYEQKLKHALRSRVGPLAVSEVSALGPDSHFCEDLDADFMLMDVVEGIKHFYKLKYFYFDGSIAATWSYDVYCADGKIVGRGLQLHSGIPSEEVIVEHFDSVLTAIVQYYENAFGCEMESSVIKDVIDFGVVDSVVRTDKLKWVSDGRAVTVNLNRDPIGGGISLSLYDYSKEMSARRPLWNR